MGVLPDTSVWVRYLRERDHGTADPLDALLTQGDVVMCGPVAAELMAGTGAEGSSELWSAIRGLPWADLDREAWRRVGEVAAALRRAGASLPLTDVEIAVAAERAGAALWTSDRDVDRLAEAMPELARFRPGQPGVSR